MSKFKERRKKQTLCLPYVIEDYVPEGSLARVIDRIVESLDTKAIEEKYSELGQRTYHPKILLKLMFYGYATGVRSGRKISSKTETDIAYMCLAEMYQPDFRTINDFRKNNTEEVQGYFVDLVKICQGLGMAKVGTIAIDSTKIRANASNRRTKNRKGYERWLKRVDQQIAEIFREAEETDAWEDKEYGNRRGDELPEKLRKSKALRQRIQEVMNELKDDQGKKNLTDRDAAFMKGQVRKDTNYNCQTVVTEDQIIVAADVTKEASDHHALEGMIRQSEENTDKPIKVVLADSGYGDLDNYDYMKKEEIDGYVPDLYNRQGGRPGRGIFGEKDFQYNKEDNCYVCPAGQNLELAKIRIANGRIKRRQYIYQCKACAGCCLKSQCTRAKYRTIAREFRQSLVDEMREKLKSPSGKKIYSQRKYMIEPVFGHIKFNLGYKRFLLRTLEKVQGEFRLMCIGYNLTKLWKRGVLAA